MGHSVVSSGAEESEESGGEPRLKLPIGPGGTFPGEPPIDPEPPTEPEDPEPQRLEEHVVVRGIAQNPVNEFLQETNWTREDVTVALTAVNATIAAVTIYLNTR